MLYTTDQVIKLIKDDKSLIFQAYTGTYEGNAIKFNPILKMIVWHNNDTDEIIMMDEDFINTKWKLMSAVHAELIRKPLFRKIQECLAF